MVMAAGIRLFRSVFNGGPSIYEGLRGVIGDIVVLSRIRALPVSCLRPIISSLGACRGLFGISFLFAATDRPILDKLVRNYGPGTTFGKVSRVARVVPYRFGLRSGLQEMGLDVGGRKEACSRITRVLDGRGEILYVIGAHHSTGRLCAHLPRRKVALRLSGVVYPTRVDRALRGLGGALGSSAGRIVHIISARLVRTKISVSFPVMCERRTKLSSMLRTTNQYGQRKGGNLDAACIFSLSGRRGLPGKRVRTTGGTELDLNAKVS